MLGSLVFKRNRHVYTVAAFVPCQPWQPAHLGGVHGDSQRTTTKMTQAKQTRIKDFGSGQGCQNKRANWAQQVAFSKTTAIACHIQTIRLPACYDCILLLYAKHLDGPSACR